MGLKVVLWEQQPRSDKTCCIKIYLNRDKHKYHGLNLYCLPKDFNHKIGRVKSSRQNHNSINTEIVKAYDRFEKIMLENPSIGVEQIVNIYNSGTNTGKLSLLDFIDLFIKECENGKMIRSIARIKHYKTFKNKLTEFNPYLNFKDINKDFYNEFVAHLRKKSLSDNSIGLHINVLKAIINEANERNLCSINEHRKKYFKAFDNETEAVYLDEQEINKIIGLNLSKCPHLQQERDRFLLSYFFLLRYSDSIRLSKDMFTKRDGQLFLTIRSQKTNTETILPVKPLAEKILKRNNYEINGDTNQESNWKLKEIVELSKIDKVKVDKITTHTARRSGATNLFLSGVPEKTIMDLGGWKKIDTFRKYIRASKLETAQRMADHPFFK